MANVGRRKCTASGTYVGNSLGRRVTCTDCGREVTVAEEGRLSDHPARRTYSGGVVWAARLKAGLRQRDVARLAALTAREIDEIENGPEEPDPDILDRVLGLISATASARGR